VLTSPSRWRLLRELASQRVRKRTSAKPTGTKKMCPHCCPAGPSHAWESPFVRAVLSVVQSQAVVVCSCRWGVGGSLKSKLMI
jgi:hypothetical protein